MYVRRTGSRVFSPVWSPDIDRSNKKALRYSVGLLYSFLRMICDGYCPHPPDKMNVAAPEGRPGGDSVTIPTTSKIQDSINPYKNSEETIKMRGLPFSFPDALTLITCPVACCKDEETGYKKGEEYRND
jgi:hypothetical protein